MTHFWAAGHQLRTAALCCLPLPPARQSRAVSSKKQRFLWIRRIVLTDWNLKKKNSNNQIKKLCLFEIATDESLSSAAHAGRMRDSIFSLWLEGLSGFFLPSSCSSQNFSAHSPPNPPFKEISNLTQSTGPAFSCSKMQIETRLPASASSYSYCIYPPPPTTTTTQPHPLSVFAVYLALSLLLLIIYYSTPHRHRCSPRLLSIRISPRIQMCSRYDLFRGEESGGERGNALRAGCALPEWRCLRTMPSFITER